MSGKLKLGCCFQLNYVVAIVVNTVIQLHVTFPVIGHSSFNDFVSRTVKQLALSASCLVDVIFN